MMLPDIDLGSWTEYQKQELQRQLDEKMQGFGLNEMLSEKVAGLQEVVGQINPFDQPEPEAQIAAPPPVAPPEPSPAPMPPPETAPVAVSPPPPPPPSPVQQAGPSPLTSAITAVQQAGGDVGQFIEAFNSGVGDQGARARVALQQAIRPPTPTPAVRPDLVPPVSRPLEPPSRGLGVSPTQVAPSAPAGAVNPNPTPAEVRAYITESARARGIDPNIALKVANSEGGFEAARRGTFKTGSSWWPFQLHYGGAGYEQLGNVAGMGNQFTKETGYQPGDPNAWQAATDYALDKARSGGWGAWYGAKAQGIEGFQGIDRSSATNLGQGADISRPQVRDVSQFGDTELSAADAAAACGPAAAVRFAQRFGRNPTLSEAVNLARTVGWTQQQGMAGIASEKSLMEKLGVPVELVMGRDWNRVTQEAQTGNPVTVSTSKHYFTIDDYDPKTGKYHVGASGTDLRGGSDWMSSGQMEAALGGGAMQGALVADNPTVATQSIAGMESNPLDWVGRQKDSAIQQIQQLGGGVNAAFGEVVREPVEQKPVSTLGTREEDLGDIVVRQLDQAIDRVGQAKDAAVKHVVGDGSEWEQTGRELLQSPLTPWGAADMMGKFGQTGLGQMLEGPLINTDEDLLARATPEQLRTATKGASLVNPEPTQSDVADVLRGTRLGEAYAGERTGAGPRLLGGVADDAPPGVHAAAADQDKIIAQRQAVSRGELPTDPTPDDVNRVLNGLSLAAENVGDRRARIKAIETYMEGQLGHPLTEDQKIWMRMRVFEGRQDAALAQLEADVSPALRQVPVEDRVYLDAFLEQMDNVDKAAATRRTVEADVGTRPLRPVAGTAAAERAEVALRNAERDLGRLEKLEAEGRGPGVAAMQAAEAKVTRLQDNLDDLSARTAERQTGRIETEALEEMGREPLRLSLRDAQLRFRDAERAYDAAVERSAWGGYDPTTVKAAERELDRAEWQLLKAEESAEAASEARTTRIGERAEEDIARIEDTGPRETPAMARASRDVQYAERDLARAQRNVEARGAEAQQTVVAQAESRLDRAMEHLQAETQAAEAARAERATAAGRKAQAERMFSGGARAQDEGAVREAWRQRLGNERFGTLETAAEAVWRTGDRIRDRLTQAGVYDEDMTQFFKDNFPHYVRTNILEHWSDEAIDALPRGAKSFSVGSDGVKRLTEAGTEKARQAPTSALVDMAFRAEELAQRNEIMRTMAGWADQPGMEMFVKKLEGDAPAPRGYMAVSYMDGANGKQRIAVPDELKDALNLSKPNLGLAGIMMNAASFPLRAGATALRPAFIAFNMTNDLLWSLYRFAVEAPDPVEGARAMKDLARGYRAAFGGDPGLVQRSREAGGTIGGIRTRYENPDVIARELAGEHVWVRPIRTGKDFQTLLKDGWGATTDVAGLLWSRPLNMVGRPIEEAPRLGAFARAERLGLSPTEAAMAKRTQTADFDAGGLFVKQANNLIPFLNATTQATTEFTALSKKHPVKSAAAQAVIMSAIISTEIYNRAVAPEEYKDVSRHTRDHGMVVMSDKPAQGDGKRGLAFIPLRGGIGALVPLVREAMGRMYGDDPRTWQRLALEVLGTLSPVEPDLTGGGLAQLMPPPLKLGTELLTNYDIFRDQPIVSESLQGLPPSEQYTERTSQTARMLSRSGLPGVGGKPAAAIDYAVRGFSPGPGEALLGAADEIITRSGNALPERPAKGEPGARDLPVVGGIVGRFLRTAGEERRTEAYEAAEQIMERNRQQTLDSVQQSEVYKAATPDRQQQMLRALEDELQQGAFDIAGVEPKDRDLGLPDKYIGVTDPKQTRAIDEARSAYDAWKSDPGRAPMPTDEQIVMALSQGKALNPLYRIESKFDEEENAEIRHQVQLALAAERAKRQKR